MAHCRRQLESDGMNSGFLGGESYNVPPSTAEFEMALSQCHDSSSGQNDVSYAFLSRTSDKACSVLLVVYNLIWNTGCFPFS